MNQVAAQLVIFIGPPGSGKGTLSQLCVDRLGWRQLSTGALFRKHIAEQTPIGKSIDFAIKSGKLVSDELVTSMAIEWLADTFNREKSDIILDGFPRTVAQAAALKEFIGQQSLPVEIKVVRFYMTDEGIIRRLMARRMCSTKACQAVYSVIEGSPLAPKKHNECDKCSGVLERRSDDTEEAIKNRLKTYHDHEKKLLDFYRNDPDTTMLELDVDKTSDSVFADFTKAIGFKES